MTDPGTVTRAVNAIVAGELPVDANPSVKRIYDELRMLAHSKLEGEAQATLNTTDLVHDAFLKLFRPDQKAWESRRHFFGSAARAMQQLLIEWARRNGKRPITLDELPDGVAAAARVNPVELAEAISLLESKDPEMAELARLRFFAGLSMVQIAEALGVSERIVKRNWIFARTWLFNNMRDDATTKDGLGGMQ
jgi:RNA polymerase sigma factor (TIGR02999 family)